MIPAEFTNALNACKEPDWVLLGIVADWLEDHGDEMAASLRWAVREKKWPKLDTTFSWWHEVFQKNFPNYPQHCRLSRALWLEWYVIYQSRAFTFAKSVADAFTDLHQMLTKSGTLTTA